jgi:hypothetical protein
MEALRSKDAEVRYALQKFTAGFGGCRAMLRKKKVSESFKKCAPLFRTLGYSVEAEASVDEGFLEISQNLMGGFTATRILTTQSLRQLISGPGTVFLNSGVRPRRRP